MEKDFKNLKFYLLFYRHIYLIYAIIIVILSGFLVSAIINEHETWYVILQSALILFLIFIAVFKIPKERNEIKRKSDVFLLTLASLRESMKVRITKLMVLENEFDVLKEKAGAVGLIQDRLASIHIATIEEGVKTAQRLGGSTDEIFITQFTLPSTIPELYKHIKDMKADAEKEKEEITMMFEKIDKLAKKF